MPAVRPLSSFASNNPVAAPALSLCSALPEELCQLAGLTRLSLDRNYLRELPASLARMQGLEELRWAPII